MQEESEQACCNLSNFYTAFGHSIMVKLNRVLITVQVFFVVFLVSVIVAVAIFSKNSSFNQVNDYANKRIPSQFLNFNKQLNRHLQAKLARLTNIVDAMAQSYADISTNANIFRYPASINVYTGAGVNDWTQSEIYCVYNSCPLLTTATIMQRLNYMDFIVPSLITPKLQKIIKRVSVMGARNGTANNVNANFVKFWPRNPYNGKPAQVLSTFNYNYFNLAKVKDGPSVFISQPYLDFKDLSNDIIFSVSRTLNLGASFNNVMLFFIVEAYTTGMVEQLVFQSAMADMQIAVIGNQGLIYDSPSYWVNKANFMQNYVFNLQSVTGISSKTFVSLSTTNIFTVKKSNARGIQQTYEVGVSAISMDFDSTYSNLKNVLIPGASKLNNVGIYLLIYVPYNTLFYPIVEASLITVNDITGQMFTMIAYSILIIIQLAGFIYLIRSTLVGRLERLLAASDKIYTLNPNDSIQRKQILRKQIEEELDNWPFEYDDIFNEFWKMSNYIIDSKTEFELKNRNVAYGPNKYSKELLKEQALQLEINPPPLLED